MRTLLLLLLVAGAYAQVTEDGFCEGLECQSKEELLTVIRHLQAERQQYNLHKGGVFVNYEQPKEASSDSSDADSSKRLLGAKLFQLDAADPPTTDCNICNSLPCLNGGVCVADLGNPWSKYICNCPDNFAGSQCQTNITCTSGYCGKNANCYVSNHQRNCICQLGYSSSNPKNGCNAKIQQACADGDPHFTTFDNLHFDYQGTCPYVFSQPCGNLTNGYAGYKVVAKNQLITGAPVAYVKEVEVTMYDQKIHIDGAKNNAYFNGFRTSVPYYWPSKSLQKISVTYSSGVFYIANDQLVKVTFNTNGRLCIQVPDVPEFRGNKTLCGLAGNVDGIYKNDVVEKNGTVFTITTNPEPNKKDIILFNRAQDTWITSDFMYLHVGDDKCVTGEQLGNNTDCDPQQAAVTCDPIRQAALSPNPPFGACMAMGNDTIMNFYDNCIFDVCHQPAQKCNVFTNFARTCQLYVPNTDLAEWRTVPSVNCPLTCPTNSHYSSCASSCPATCADQSAPDFCDIGCSEGCTCDAGFVLDTSNLGSTTCIRVESCGCSDTNGNTHPADTPWLTFNCSVWNQCRNGTYFSKRNQCSQYGICSTDSFDNMACTCAPGFTGDGYNCTDINECLDDKSCSVDKNQGTCTNTIGSYNCTCNEYFSGRDCQYYLPRRHCADLFKYWQYTTSGTYTINPPYAFNTNKAFADYTVYCDMTTTGGGWTLMSHDSADGMANKTMDQYRTGFGDAGTQNIWLGLDLIAGMTAEINTSLRLNLYRCPHNNLPALTTDCTYKFFSIGNEALNYVVTIPEVCTGSEKEYYDGWARWDLNSTGPAFIAYDNDHSNASCSDTFRRTGFWYDTSVRCGDANLNGVRFSCDNIPDTSDGQTFLYWSGSPLGEVWLSLRPTDYPDYDQHVVTPVNWQKEEGIDL